MEGDCMDTLLRIRDEMHALTTGGDPEGDHGEADDLLLELIAELMERLSPMQQEIVARILADYGSVRKWYA
jgi:hypothetical protein